MRYRFFFISLLFELTFAQDIQHPIFWERSYYINATNPSSYENLVPSTSVMAISQDFQTFCSSVDEKPRHKILLDFGEACHDSNLKLSDFIKTNTGPLSLIDTLENTQIAALIQRGHCTWSEKLQTIQHLALSLDLDITTFFLFNNQTSQEPIRTEFVAPNASSILLQLPKFPHPTDTYLQMSDNDLPMTCLGLYVIPNIYGQLWLSRIHRMDRQYWILTPYFGQTVSSDSTDGFYLDGKNYIVYAIIITVFILMSFVGIHWWRSHQRNRTRSLATTKKPKNQPLPKDILDRMPISPFHENSVKNTGCPICLDDFVSEKTSIRILDCGHGFCVGCIGKCVYLVDDVEHCPWFGKESTLCPICKYDCLGLDKTRVKEGSGNRSIISDLDPSLHCTLNLGQPYVAIQDTHSSSQPIHISPQPH